MLYLRVGLWTGALLLPLACPAQSFNCDLDIGSGPPYIGDGAPPPDYGAGAGQIGVWNRLDAAGPVVPTTLVGLDGLPTGATILATGTRGSYGGFNFPDSGGFMYLMNDFADVGEANAPTIYHFAGFEPGRYLIYTFAVNPAAAQPVDVTVIVAGALNTVQHVTGPLQANVFQEGVTHTVHDLQLSGSTFEVEVFRTNWGPYDGECNGFQIVRVVPEPATAPVLALGLAACLLLPRSQHRGICS